MYFNGDKHASGLMSGFLLTSGYQLYNFNKTIGYVFDIDQVHFL